MKKELYLILSIIAIILLAVYSCEDKWVEYYDDYPETVNKHIWDELKNDSRVSRFIEILTDNQYDTLFNGDVSYTLFIPGNEALDAYLGANEITNYFLNYFISPLFIQSGNISNETRLVQTLGEKYIHFVNQNGKILLDGVEIAFESPLYLDGKYFILEDMIEPRPNLYQYFKVSNPVLSDYIDSQDSVILDKELSVPIGFDDFGNTIYDTVSDVVNMFEVNYFPVKQEDRRFNATIVFPKSENYNQALNVMAGNLGESIVDYRDIPLDWQYEVLMPYLFERGIFRNLIEPKQFEMRSETDSARLMNVLGDSVAIGYVPSEKTICSNGYAYDYTDFEIPERLYNGTERFEPEQLLKQTGLNRYAWVDEVSVQTSLTVLPKKVFISTASNDSILQVDFPSGYTGDYTVEFKGPKLFPRRYLMVIRTHMDFGGIYDIYVNDVLAGTFDYAAYLVNRGGWIYSVSGSRYLPEGRYNRFDMYVESVTTYGKVDIRFEYKGPGGAPNNSLVVDYIDFVPAN